MAPLERYTRRHHIRRLAKEIHNAAACLNASQAADLPENRPECRALEGIGRYRPLELHTIDFGSG
jgi:hypothetical protein